MKILRDPSWQFVGALIGIFSLILFFVTRPYKALRVEVLSNSPLISVTEDIASDLDIFFKDKPIESLSLILLRFENTGNEPIKNEDYSEPIHISISQDAEFGEVSIQETRPIGIPLTPTITSNNRVELASVLLNPGDQAILKILALNNDGSLKIEARIAGISDIEIQSVLEGNNPAQPLSDIGRAFVIVFLLILMSILLVLNSRRFIEWRKQRFGYDPAHVYYIKAQSCMLNSDITYALHYLDEAFSWDKSYVEKSQKDSVFASIQGYARYKELIGKYEQP